MLLTLALPRVKIEYIHLMNYIIWSANKYQDIVVSCCKNWTFPRYVINNLIPV